MTIVRKTISVTSQQDKWIKAQMAKGGFASESEVLRHLIRKEQTMHSDVALSDESKTKIIAHMKKHDETLQKLAR